MGEFVHFSPIQAGSWSAHGKSSVRALADGPKYLQQLNWSSVASWEILLTETLLAVLDQPMDLSVLINAT